MKITDLKFNHKEWKIGLETACIDCYGLKNILVICNDELYSNKIIKMNHKHGYRHFNVYDNIKDAQNNILWFEAVIRSRIDYLFVYPYKLKENYDNLRFDDYEDI
ncbi:hypothetical protein [Photorhabdus luminescens]|uniref:Uncharacterized protein n=1 Tax=Photorhabdus luminescens subsp. sonorensis TaxID=1173677 RepID=A0A5C4RIB7_PHOLU|nr:hypothetical protein [Photorhabdus luminescens]TNH43800.1 hypothetical protein EP164_09655 [Photorhabdus luminescens subsp. sonorensis]